MISPEDFLALKRKAEQARREADRAAGAAQQLRERLKKEFGVKDEAAAETVLKELAKEERKLEKLAAEQYQKLKDDFPQFFSEND